MEVDVAAQVVGESRLQPVCQPSLCVYKYAEFDLFMQHV